MAEEITGSQNSSEAVGGEKAVMPSPAVSEPVSLLGGSGGEEEGQKPEHPRSEQKEEAKEAEVIPEKAEDYRIEFAPDTQVDQELLQWFQGWALERKMPLREAEAMAKQYESMVKARAQELERKQLKQLSEQEAAWRKQAVDDLGPNRAEGLAAVNRFMKEFAPGEDHPLRKLFDKTGLGSHPDMVRLAVNVGQRLGEPAFVRSNDSAPPRTLAETLYPDQGLREN
jgi:hypothetical protein